MNNKLKLAISPFEEMWNKQDFRDLVEEMVADVENTEMFIITDNTDVTFIIDVTTQSGIDQDNVFILADSIAIVNKLIAEKISIEYLKTIFNVNILYNFLLLFLISRLKSIIGLANKISILSFFTLSRSLSLIIIISEITFIIGFHIFINYKEIIKRFLDKANKNILFLWS